jgi:hypothetical protein
MPFCAWNPQAKHVAVPAADLDPRHDLEGIAAAAFVSPQAGVQCVVIRDGDHVEASLGGHVVQHVGHAVMLARPSLAVVCI